MGIIAWIILGALAGWVASMIMGTDGNQGAIGNIVVGIIGAFFGEAGVTGFNIRSFLVALLGSVIALIIYRALFGRSHHSTM
jgi:uncharacterized membrane protein YeaQ/YmgE (transglycosylase-associated protein family)